MKRHLLIVIATALLLGAVQPGTASAQYFNDAGTGNKGGTWSVSPLVGGVSFGGNHHRESAPVFGVRGGYNFTKYLGVEALFDYAKTRSTLSSDTVDFYRYGADLLLHAWPEDRFVPYLAAGYAGVSLQENKGSFDLGAGFKYFVTQDMAWRADVRGIFYDNSLSKPVLEYTAGVYIPFGGPDVVKLADPPPAPEPFVRPVVIPPPLDLGPPAVPPPPPPAPDVILSAAPASITRGEKSILTWKSRRAESCEMKPGIGAVQINGSLSVAPEKDTLYTLTCKGKGGSSGSSAAVVVAEPIPAAVAEPTAQQRFCNRPALLVINFDVDKHAIKPMYHAELKTVGDFLNEFPEAYGEISGHTDSTHTRQYNQKLSERRANAVREYIVKNFGINPKRVTSKGYGEDKPVTSNKTAAGRAKNRRIEANFVCEEEAKPQPASAPEASRTPLSPAASPQKGKGRAVPSAAAPARPPVTVAGQESGATPASVPKAQRGKGAASPGLTPARVAEQQEAAPQSAVPPAQRKQEPVQSRLERAAAAEQAQAAPAPSSVPAAQRQKEARRIPVTSAPAAPVAASASAAAVAPEAAADPDVPPLGSALRQQEPEPPPVDEEPFVLMTEKPRPAAEGKITLTGITIDRNGVSLFTEGKVEDFRIITQVEPYSLVIDIPGAVNGIGTMRAPVNKFDLLDVGFRDTPEYLRIVVHADREEIIPYRSVKNDAGLRINIKPRSSHHIGP